MGMVQGGLQYASADNAAKDLHRATSRLTDRMRASQRHYQERRPQAAAQRQTALRSQLGLYSPMNQMLGDMSGGRYSIDTSGIAAKSPLEFKATGAELDTAGTPYDQMDTVTAAQRLGQVSDLGYDVSRQRSELAKKNKEFEGATQRATSNAQRLSSGGMGSGWKKK